MSTCVYFKSYKSSLQRSVECLTVLVGEDKACLHIFAAISGVI